MIYKSTQSKAILGAGLFSILLTQIAGYQSALTLGARITAALTSLISYIGLAYNANCLVGGGCAPCLCLAGEVGGAPCLCLAGEFGSAAVS